MKISPAAANVTTATTSISKTNPKRSSGSAERDFAVDDVVETKTKDKPSPELAKTSTNGQAYPEVEIDSPTSGGGGQNSGLTVQARSATGDNGDSSSDSGRDDDRDDENRRSTVIDKIA